MLKSHISWRAIDHDGKLQSNTFRGTRRHFKQFINQHQLQLLCAQRHFKITLKKQQANTTIKFTADLAALLNSDLELITAMDILKQRYTAPEIHNNIEHIIQALHDGVSLSTALARCPLIFPKHYLPLLKAAEATQQLPLILSRIVEQQNKMLTIKNKLQKALIYPASVCAFTAFISIGLLTFAIPQFQAIFNNFNAQLPTFTQYIIDCSTLLTNYKYLILVGSCAVSIGFYTAYKKCVTVRSGWQNMLMHLPWIKTLYRHKLIFNWCTVLAICLNAELTINDCLMLSSNTLTNNKLRRNCQLLSQHIATGQPLHQALAITLLFDQAQLQLIQLGEASNKLPNSLERLATEATFKLEQQLESLSKWLEPVIMLVLAVVAGSMIISMYLPIFKIGAIL